MRSVSAAAEYPRVRQPYRLTDIALDVAQESTRRAVWGPNSLTAQDILEPLTAANARYGKPQSNGDVRSMIILPHLAVEIIRCRKFWDTIPELDVPMCLPTAKLLKPEAQQHLDTTSSLCRCRSN